MRCLTGGVGMAPFNIPQWEQTKDGTPLAARCLILDDGDTRLAVISSTHLELFRPEAMRIKEAVSEAIHLPPESILLAGTHVHSGPPTLTSDRDKREEFATHIAAAAVSAAYIAATLQPVRIGWITDHLAGVSRVRRVLRRDGSIITLRRAWPQYWGWATDPQTVGPEEPLDDLLTVLRVEDLDGRPVGAVMHFTCHPIPDFFGYAARLVEQNVPGLVCLVLNGCFGSVDTPFEVPMRGRTQADQLPILGDILGYRTLELLARAETRETAPLGVASRPIFLPLDPRFRDNPAARLDTWAKAIAEGGFHTETQCIRIGDVAFAGIPGEPQVGFARDIAEASPFPLTRGVGNCNHSCAYLIREESRARGGYEADPALWGAVSGQGLPAILAGIRECLAELAGRVAPSPK